MAGVVIAGMVWGAWRGVVWQLASIASLVVGYSVAHALSGGLSAYFPGEPIVARALAMVTVYAAVAGGVFLVAWMIRATLRKMKFEAFDRHLGMILGGMEGVLLGLVGTLFVASLAPQTRDPIFASPTGKLVGQVMSVLGPVLPEEARGVLGPFWSPRDSVADDLNSTPSTEPSSGAATTARRGPGHPASSAPGKIDPAASPASLSDVIEEGEARLEHAIAEAASKRIERTPAGGTNDGSPARR
jgi:membrane protein required for colicin V production